MLAPSSAPIKRRAFRGGAVGALREHNRAAVLRALVDRGALSRTDLARSVGLTQPALSYIAAELLADGLIEEVTPGIVPPTTGDGASAAPPRAARGPGRQAILLDIAPCARLVAAVHVGANGLEVGLVDLRASLVAEESVRMDPGAWGADPEGLVRHVAHSVRRLAQRAGVAGHALLGAGVGVAGWVDGERGLVRQHPQLGWRDVPLAALLARALDLPVFLEDHVRAMALAEAWFGAGGAAESFALLYIGAVVGCSVVFGRQVHRGAHGAAGGIGYLPVAPASHEAHRPGQRPAARLEDVVTEPAFLDALRAVAGRYPSSVAARWLAAPGQGEQRRLPPSGELADLLAAAEAHGSGDRPTRDVLRRRAAALAPYVAQVLATYDPAVLAVAGPMAWSRSALQLELLAGAVQELVPELSTRFPRIVPAACGRHGALIGAAALVLQMVYSPPLATDDSATEDVATAAAVRRRIGARP